jgi:uncharacterized protein YndB with AHSA1/START domain
MNDFGSSPAPGTVRLARLLPGPVERVWEYLTDENKLARWLAHGRIEPRVGGKAELRFRMHELTSELTPAKYADMPCDFDGVVTRWQPPSVLAYTWAESLGDPSEVTFELRPRGADVELIITHRRLSSRELLVGVAAGWDAHVGILADLLAARAVRPFWSTHVALEAEYDRRLPPR